MGLTVLGTLCAVTACGGGGSSSTSTPGRSLAQVVKDDRLIRFIGEGCEVGATVGGRNGIAMYRQAGDLVISNDDETEGQKWICSAEARREVEAAIER